MKSRIQVESSKRATAIKQVTPSHSSSSETIIFDYVHLTQKTEVKKMGVFHRIGLRCKRRENDDEKSPER